MKACVGPTTVRCKFSTANQILLHPCYVSGSTNTGEPREFSIETDQSGRVVMRTVRFGTRTGHRRGCLFQLNFLLALFLIYCDIAGLIKPDLLSAMRQHSPWFSLKRKGRQDDSPDIHWRRWRQASTSPVNTKAVNLTTFPFLCIWCVRSVSNHYI